MILAKFTVFLEFKNELYCHCKMMHSVLGTRRCELANPVILAGRPKLICCVWSEAYNSLLTNIFNWNLQERWRN